jgi:hypothetical protein
VSQVVNGATATTVALKTSVNPVAAGQALTLTTSVLTAGTHVLTAMYLADASLGESSKSADTVGGQ